MDVISWLLEGDPAVRWQTLADLTDASAEEVTAERARVATEGWGAALLAEQDPDGRWDGGTYRPGWADERRPFFDAWTATHFTLQSLMELGLDPESPPVPPAIDRVRQNVRWEENDALYFEGETEPCVNGIALAVGSHFGEDVSGIERKLLASRQPDGGWNCDTESAVSSFHSTICALEGLLAREGAGHGSDELRDARRTGEEYLLRRRLFRRLADGSVADPRFTMLSFPVRWFYDVLRALEYFRLADRRDERCEEAVEIVRRHRGQDGRWSLQNGHEGPSIIRMESPEGTPSRWITLRALRVLRWWDASHTDGPHGDPQGPSER